MRLHSNTTCNSTNSNSFSEQHRFSKVQLFLLTALGSLLLSGHIACFGDGNCSLFSHGGFFFFLKRIGFDIWSWLRLCNSVNYDTKEKEKRSYAICTAIVVFAENKKKRIFLRETILNIAGFIFYAILCILGTSKTSLPVKSEPYELLLTHTTSLSLSFSWIVARASFSRNGSAEAFGITHNLRSGIFLLRTSHTCPIRM